MSSKTGKTKTRRKRRSGECRKCKEVLFISIEKIETELTMEAVQLACEQKVLENKIVADKQKKLKKIHLE